MFPGSQCYCKMHYMFQLIHLYFTETCNCFSWNTQAPFTGKVSDKEAIPTDQFLHQSPCQQAGRWLRYLLANKTTHWLTESLPLAYEPWLKENKLNEIPNAFSVQCPWAENKFHCDWGALLPRDNFNPIPLKNNNNATGLQMGCAFLGECYNHSQSTI